jgi:DNA repair protein RecN (Recombination protein N)
VNSQSGSLVRELGVSGLAIIDSLRVELGPGLTVLTGETGAGKSLLVDAFALARGSRADTGAIRAGSERLHIDLLMADAGGEKIVVREVYAEGRSVARLNDELVTIARLAQEIGSRIEIHGQHDQQRLGDPARQRDLLDRWSQSMEIREEVAELIDRRSQLEVEYAELGGDDSRRDALLAIARAERTDLKAAAVEQGEEAKLKEELRRATNGDRIDALYGEITSLFDGEPASLRPISTEIERASRELVRLDDSAAALGERLTALSIEIDDIARDLTRRAPGEVSGRSVPELEERLGLLLSLQRRFKTDEAGLGRALEAAVAEVTRLEGADARRAEIERGRVQLNSEIAVAALALRERRRAGAGSLAKAVNRALGALDLPSSFVVLVQARSGADGDPLVEGASCLVDRSGGDEVSYVFAPNPGEPAGPIAKIASGGELSRLSLALEEALSDASEPRTLIFDEIDAGLGGRAGEALGRSLRRISRQHQVLCVTHLAQVAAHADTHLHVAKGDADGRTVTSVRTLSAAERVEELAAMLAGDGAGSGATAAAKELLAAAKREA